MSGVCVKFSVGTNGGAGSLVPYDTKERATEGRDERVWTRNIPGYVEGKEQEIASEREVATPDMGRAARGRVREMSYKERRANLAEYARQRDEDERGMPHKGKGETRTYYRAIYSFHKDPGDEKIREMVDEHQDGKFTRCSIINSIHRNSGHVHVHSIIFARQTDDKKLQLGWKSYREIDEDWAKIYGRQFGEHFTKEHLEKKRERREHRVAAREAKARGESVPPRPPRTTHERNQAQERIDIAKRERGVELYDETRVGRDQREPSGADRVSGGATAERAAARAGRREQLVEGRDRRPPRETRGLGGGARQPARDGRLVSEAEGERTGGTHGVPAANERPAPERIESSGRGGGQARRGAGGVGDEARDVERAGRGGEASGAPSADGGRQLEETIKGDVRPHDQSGGRETENRRAVADQGTGHNPAHDTSRTASGDGYARGVDSIPGASGEQLRNDMAGAFNPHADMDSDLRSDLDMELDVVLMPLRDQREREEQARAPESVSTPASHLPALEPEHVPEIEHDFGFDR
jgi:hypothetical protein